MDRLSTTPTQSLIRQAMFNLLDWAIMMGGLLGPGIAVKCLSQGHNDTLPSSGTESRQPCDFQLAFLYTEQYRH